MNEEMNPLKMQILEAREKRVFQIEQLLHHKKVVLSLRANYPGDEKDNPITRTLVDKMHTEVTNHFTILMTLFLNNGEGPVCLYVVDASDVIQVKKAAIAIETNHPLGRLIDLDVYYKTSRSISRADVNAEMRSCYLCQADAFHCIRNQTHSLEEIKGYIKKVVTDDEA